VTVYFSVSVLNPEFSYRKITAQCCWLWRKAYDNFISDVFESKSNWNWCWSFTSFGSWLRLTDTVWIVDNKCCQHSMMSWSWATSTCIPLFLPSLTSERVPIRRPSYLCMALDAPTQSRTHTLTAAGLSKTRGHALDQLIYVNDVTVVVQMPQIQHFCA